MSFFQIVAAFLGAAVLILVWALATAEEVPADQEF
jgi:uncharacterized membrane protein YeaQ/YmgE (transglycosylase-associated protein family)